MSKQYVHYGNDCYDPNAVPPITQSPFLTKPLGGFWVSPVDAEFGWRDWCISEEFHTENLSKHFTFTLTNNTRVLYISNLSDLDNLPTLERTEFLLPWNVALDFLSLAKQYDAIEVNFSNDQQLRRALNTWDCDSILIINPDIVIVDKK